MQHLRRDDAFSNAFSYFDLSEKGAQVSVVVDIDNAESINDLQLLSHVIQKGSKTKENSSETAKTILAGEHI